MPGKQRKCEKCGRRMRSDNLKRHQIKSCQRKKKQEDDENILSTVYQRAGMDSMTTEASQSKILSRATNARNPTESSMKVDDESDSDQSNSSDKDARDEDEIEYEVMSDKFSQLTKAFRNQYHKLDSNIEIYDKLLLMLDEMKRLNLLTKEECSVMNEYLMKKIRI